MSPFNVELNRTRVRASNDSKDVTKILRRCNPGLFNAPLISKGCYLLFLYLSVWRSSLRADEKLLLLLLLLLPVHTHTHTHKRAQHTYRVLQSLHERTTYRFCAHPAEWGEGSTGSTSLKEIFSFNYRLLTHTGCRTFTFIVWFVENNCHFFRIFCRWRL